MMEIDRLPPHPNPIPNPHHRKLDLQSPLDLVYIRENITRAAQEKLDLHFPVAVNAKKSTPNKPTTTTKTAGKAGESAQRGAVAAGGSGQEEGQEGDDPMRARVSALVNQFLDRTFEFAQYNISVNGSDAAPTTNTTTTTNPATQPRKLHPLSTSTATSTQTARQAEEGKEEEREGTHFRYAAYDPRLSTRLSALYAELERETLAVSQLRRTAPSRGAELRGAELLRVLAAEEGEGDETRRKRVRRSRRSSEDGADAGGEGSQSQSQSQLQLDPLPAGWNDEVREMYERGLAGLKRLAGVDAGGAGAHVKGAVGGGGGAAAAAGGGSLTETLGKVQRARDVAREFE